MVLNYIWIFFFLTAFVVALFRLVILGDVAIFPAIVDGLFDMAKTGFELSLGLTGVLALWLGFMKIGEQSGIVHILYKFVGPLFRRLFPSIPPEHPVYGPMIMNFSMNMLGLDNAATPLGLKTMQGLQELNPHKDTASDAQILFLVLNTSGLTLIPINILVYRAQMGAVDPTDIFIPILLATFVSTIVGLIVVSLYQRINLLNPVVLAYLGSLTLFILGIIWYFQSQPPEVVQQVSSVVSNLILFGIIITFIVLGLIRKINIYDAFIEGAKEGFQVAITIIPYLIAILVAIAVFRACGAMDYLINGIAAGIEWVGINSDFVPSLPTALMKPLSGSGARGMMLETMETYGADSFAGRLSSVMQGSTETTFYVLAVYFGSVNIRKTRYAVTCGLLADLAGIIASILLAYLFFHGVSTS